MRVFNVLVAIVGLLLVAFGVVALTSPSTPAEMGRHVLTSMGLYIIAVLRVAIGVVLLLAASTSRMPRTLRVIGVVIIVAGIATPFFGMERSRAVLDWWSAQGPTFVRFAGLIAIALGGFIAYAGGPSRRAA